MATTKKPLNPVLSNALNKAYQIDATQVNRPYNPDALSMLQGPLDQAKMLNEQTKARQLADKLNPSYLNSDAYTNYMANTAQSKAPISNTTSTPPPATEMDKPITTSTPIVNNKSGNTSTQPTGEEINPYGNTAPKDGTVLEVAKPTGEQINPYGNEAPKDGTVLSPSPKDDEPFKDPTITPTTDTLVEDAQNQIYQARADSAAQKVIHDEAQQGLISMTPEMLANQEAYKKERAGLEVDKKNELLVNNRTKIQELYNKMEAELARQGLSSMDTASMNAATRQIYNAYTGQIALLQTMNAGYNNDVTEAQSQADQYYSTQQQFIRDRINNYNNILTSASNEMGRLDTKERAYVNDKLNLLKSELAIEEEKAKSVQEMATSPDVLARAIKDYGFSYDDDINTQLGKFNQAKQTQANIDTLTTTYLGARIPKNATWDEAMKLLKEDNDFITQFGKNVDVVADSKTGAMYAYNKVTGKYGVIQPGLSDAELNTLDPVDKIKLISDQTSKFITQNKDSFDVLRAVDNVLTAGAAMEEAVKTGGNISAAQETLITTFKKILDPGSAVMQGEFDRTGASQSIKDKLKTVFQSTLQGGVVSPDAAREYVAMAKQLGLFDTGKLSAQMDRLIKINQPVGIDERDLFDDYHIEIYRRNQFGNDSFSILTAYPELKDEFEAVSKVFTNKDEVAEFLIKSSINQGLGFNKVGSDTDKATNKIEKLNLGNKSITGDTTLLSKLEQANQEFFKATGKNIDINQSYRTSEQQKALYDKLSKTGARVAPPGKSFHEKGLAIDVTNWKEAEPFLRKYGLLNELADDKGHFSLGEFNNKV